jgi:predicted transcriptional regulator
MNDQERIDGTLRNAIVESGMTHYAIAKAAGIEADILDRFMKGRDIYLGTAAKIADALKLEIRPRGRRRVAR